jgi:nucleoside-diphosphate-sugar epimerase
MTRVLVTGATGFIGSHVIRQFVERGDEVVVIVRPTSDRWRIRDVVEDIRVVEGELLDSRETSDLVNDIRPDLCIHLAWYAEPGKYIESLQNLDMLSGSIQLARNLGEAGCRNFVGVGSCFEYEMTDLRLSESSVTKPNSLYAASKTAFATVLNRIGPLTGMKTAWVRPFYQYGPHEDERRLVSSVILSLLRGQDAPTTGGMQVRDFLHVSDVASAILAVSDSDLQGVVNIGGGEQMTVRSVVEAIGKATGRGHLIRFGDIPYRASDPMFVVADNTRLRSTGWTPRFCLDDGIADTVLWWQGRTGVAV